MRAKQIGLVWPALVWNVGCMGAEEVRVTGRIDAPVTLSPDELELCLDLAVVEGRGESRSERVCERPELSGQTYAWRTDLSQAGWQVPRSEMVSAELSYEIGRDIAECEVVDALGERRIECAATTRRATYMDAAELEPEAIADPTHLQLQLDWDLSRDPDAIVVEEMRVELPGRGVTSPGNRCIPRFASQDGWLAADGGRAVALPDGSMLHLFGDTLLGSTWADDARAPTFVGNSVGVARCNSQGWFIEYSFRDDGVQRQAVFDLGDGTTRLWPVDGFVQDGKLYVVLSKITETTQGLGFAYAGTVLATVARPLDDPATWSVEYQPLTPPADYRPDLGVLVHDGYLHLFSSLVDGAYPDPAILLRVSTRELADAAAHLEFLTTEGAWQPVERFRPELARVVLDASSPQLYVHEHPSAAGFITLQADATFGSPDVIVRTAPRLEGPWSPGKLVYKFPEMLQPGPDSEVVCYAVTEQFQLRSRSGHDLVLTYACNTLAGPLPPLDQLELYLPKSVVVDLEGV